MHRTSLTTASAKLGGVWRRLAQTLDSYFTEGARRAAPEITYRGSKNEIDRYHRLLHQGAVALVRVGRLSRH